MSNSMHQMCFPQPNTTIDKQGVVGIPGIFSGLYRRCPGQLIGLSFYKTVESKIFVEITGVVRVVRETDTLLVAFFLGNAATGTYKIARQLGHMVTVYVDPIQQVIYPELSRLASRADRATFVELSRKSAYLMGATTGILLIAFVMLGEPVLLFALGPAYIEAFPIAIWVLAAMLVWSVAHPLTPGIMALGAFRSFLWRNAAVTAFYIPALILFCILFGLHGAGLAFLLLYCAWFTLMLQSQTRNLENMIETRRKAIELED